MGINVLSLFDGMSCGQLALEEANIVVDNYFASEIDKNVISITQRNYPNTIQVGDVTSINSSSLPKINLLIGGSPCQGFSFAGNMLNFDDPRSSLFFEFVRLYKELSPDFFLLENVRMKKECEQVITDILGEKPIAINSSVVTAQDRKRLYWTNIPIFAFVDRHIALYEILETQVPDKFYLKEPIEGRYRSVPNYKQDVSKSCVVGKLSPYQGDRVFDINCKASSLSASGGNNGGGSCNIIIDPKTHRLRRLTVVECCRLQGVRDTYFDGFKDSYAYKALGNGWTVPVISHIFTGMKK